MHSSSHSDFLFGLVCLVSIIVRILVLLLLLLCFFRLVLLLLFALLHLAQLFPLLRKLICFGLVVREDDVVEYGPALDLPQVESKEAEVRIPVQVIVVLVLRVGDLLLFPEALACRVRDALSSPLALVLGIILHRGFPLTVLLVVPVVRLLGLWVHDALLLHPIVR